MRGRARAPGGVTSLSMSRGSRYVDWKPEAWQNPKVLSHTTRDTWSTMPRPSHILLGLLLSASQAFAQTGAYPYILKTFAGAFPLGDGGPATAALLFYPSAAIPDAAGNLYILDSDNYRVRKVTADGKIATYATFSGSSWDMAMAADGTLYIGALGGIARIRPRARKLSWPGRDSRLQRRRRTGDQRAGRRGVWCDAGRGGEHLLH